METQRCNNNGNDANYGSVHKTLEDVRASDSITVSIERKPKRVIHFSNGVVEEYSDDETCNDCTDGYKSTVDLTANSGSLVSMDSKRFYGLNQAQLLMWSVGRNALQMCDYLGEKLAALFGITTPKYNYEIEQYKRVAEQEQAYANKRRELFAGWTETEKSGDEFIKTDIRVSSAKQISNEQQPSK